MRASMVMTSPWAGGAMLANVAVKLPGTARVVSSVTEYVGPARDSSPFVYVMYTSNWAKLYALS